MRKITAALIGTAATAMMISGAGAAAASAHPASSGTEVFHLMTTSATASKVSLIATGVFTAGGVDVMGSKSDTAQFPGGTFKINHPAPTTGKPTLNQKTCLVTYKGSGNYTLSDGTGSYAGISGSGKAQITVLGIAARNSAGKCSLKLAPVSWQQVITGTGPVKL